MQDLKKQSSLKHLATEEDFLKVLKLDKAIIYLLVDWSGQERVSRHVVHKVLSGLNENGTSIFQIDCSDQRKEYVMNWLFEQGSDNKESYHSGYGELLFLNRGLIIDYIKYPGQLGLDKVLEKLADWKYRR